MPETRLPVGQRAELYQRLAEALAEPPAWLAEPGRAWPLYELAQALAEAGLTSADTVAALAGVPAEPWASRQARYAALFSGPGRPRVWLYESAFRGGRPFGPEAVAVARLYRAAGLESAAAELPDHAAMELAFLSFLAASQTGPAGAAWEDWERRFLADHAGCWLPQLGRVLVESGDAVYRLVGQLLQDVVPAAAGMAAIGPHARKRIVHQPILNAPEACSLCGFCARVCPAGALTIQETEQETWLALAAAACNGCGKCTRVCAEHVLRLGPAAEAAPVLRRSSRLTCPGCGRPAVSQAEFESVAARIGRPAWLAYCPECRSQHFQPVAASAQLETLEARP